MAARGTRNMDQGEEKIEDAAELRRLRQQARRVHRKALVLAGVLTVVAVALP